MAKQSDEDIDFAKNLAGKVISFAIHEYDKGTGNNDKQRNHYLSAKRFIASAWFDDLCTLCGLNPNHIKKKVVKCGKNPPQSPQQL